MSQVSKIIISDTSCLILLSKINELDILKQVGSEIFITPEIKNEFGLEIPSWVMIKSPKDKHYQRILEMDLDTGEASAIALSFEISHAILILDDQKARKTAEKLNLRFSGSFGLILRAKQMGKVKKIRPLIEKIKKTNFRFSEQLLQAVLDEAGE
ncbi:MAG: DUF3368 domain-containing protein [Mariniphaga sp.]|jgi:predicted nucleic acid-binding protein|nr:DUF3368 domain-containing protein [Mariniphaga sp.]